MRIPFSRDGNDDHEGFGKMILWEGEYTS